MIELSHMHTSHAPVRIAFAASYTKSILKFRGSLVSLFLGRGYDAIFLAPFIEGDEIGSKLVKLGAKVSPVRLRRKSLNIIDEIVVIASYIKIVRSRDIDILVPYTLKPVIYAGIAVLLNKISGKSGILFIPLITGLGFLFSPLAEKSIRFRVLKQIVIGLYRVSLLSSSGVIFQNNDDMALFQQLRLISSEKSTLVVNGSGVNLQEYPYSEITTRSSFTFVGRLLRSKGILHFLDVASMLAESYPEIVFNVVGGIDDSCDSIRPKDLERFKHLRNVVFWGHLDDPSPVINNSTCVVLPSVYREGVPRSLLEALSMGRLVITTNTPGCKLTCHHKKNGYLLESCDSDSLRRAVLHVTSLGSSELADMSQYSRKLVEKYFDDRLVNSQIFDFIYRKHQEA
jgi:glycosyltransferase involved in cell wall biosynthesis